MNKLIFRDYPAARLPDELRAAVGNADYVTLTIERPDPVPLSAAEVQERVEAHRRERPTRRAGTETEATDRVRQLRDEWGE